MDTTSQTVPAWPKHTVVRGLIPGLVLLVLILWGAALLATWEHYQDQVQETVTEDVRALSTNVRVTLNMQGLGLSTAMQPMVMDAQVADAVQRGDRQRLLQRWQPVYEAMRREHQVTHLYFLNQYRTCVLRVHAPLQYGDRIDRSVTLAAERSGESAYGLELGPLGTLALRVVQPIFDQGHVVGYVELGKEIGDVLQILRSRMEVWNQMAVLLRKEGLDRERWLHAQAQLGREVDWDLMPNHVLAIASQEHLSASFARWMRAAAQGQLLDGSEMPIDGRYFRVMSVPLRDVAGREIGILLALRDITDRWQAVLQQLWLVGASGFVLVAMLITVHRLQSAADRRIYEQQRRLLRAHGRLEHIIVASGVATWEWDIQANIFQVSERWASMLGYDHPGPLDRANWEARIHPEDRPLLRTLLDEHLAGQREEVACECRLLHQAGHWVWTACRARLFARSEEGSPALMFGTNTDLTAYKSAQAERQQLEQQKLEREIAELTHANRLVALGTMMAGLAHEFNHPAQVVRMNQQSLRKMVAACAEVARERDGLAVGQLSWQEIATVAPQLLEDMELATEQLHDLISNVQNYARPNEGACHGVDYDSLVLVVHSSLRLVASFARRSQVALEHALLAPEPGAQPSCNCVQQVVVNVLLNAIQASAKGASVQVGCERTNDCLRLYVADRGPGVPAEVMENLGQPFVTTRHGQGGNGLGLYICLKILEEQGGTLTLSPQQPTGTLVTITFPDRVHA